MQQKGFTEYRPGNYVYFDRTQVALGAATLDDCALTVLATVVSKPAPDRVIFDSGSKTLTNDGARGFTPTPGFGVVIGHDNLLIERLSEEHATVKVTERLDDARAGRSRPDHSESLVRRVESRRSGVAGRRRHGRAAADRRARTNHVARRASAGALDARTPSPSALATLGKSTVARLIRSARRAMLPVSDLLAAAALDSPFHSDSPAPGGLAPRRDPTASGARARAPARAIEAGASSLDARANDRREEVPKASSIQRSRNAADGRGFLTDDRGDARVSDSQAAAAVSISRRSETRKLMMIRARARTPARFARRRIPR